ncbi:MAG TPA: hypothetical protein VFE58_02115, partial [Tepidisphaeraceae bacterium]|nr:hypothetical protein [Tepidisphaeraceae bacterium]
MRSKKSRRRGVGLKSVVAGRGVFEGLERRSLLSTVVWDGGVSGTGTDWSTAANWVGDVKPVAGDDVVINTSGPTILFNGTEAVHSVTTSRAIQMNGGTLTLGGTLSATANVTMNGGTIAGGTITMSGGAVMVFDNASNVLSGGVTVNGDLDLTQQSNARVRVYGGITLNGNLLLGSSANNNYGVITFGDSTNAAGTLGGTATVVFGNYVANGIDNGSGVGGTSGTLTIAPTITLHGKSGGIYSDTAAAAIVNKGVIAADTSGGTLTISANFLNTNALSAANGDTLALTGTWTNTGTITAGSGSTVNLIGTVTTANMGTIVGTAGAVNLMGTITNTGATLAMTSATGTWFDEGATINGGTISEAGGALLVFNNYSNVLSGGVTVNGDMDLTQQSNARVRVYGGITLNGNLLLGSSANNNYGVITFGDATNSAGTFGGTATVVFGNYVANGIDNGSGVGGTSGTLTIAPTITVHGKSGGIYSDTVGAAIVNKGVIAADTSGGTLTISANFLNTNALSAASGDTLALTGTWTNTGTITAGSGSTVNLNGTVTTANMGTIVGTAGSVSLIGTITNTGATLALTSATGSWFDAGAIINGGTISETGGALLIFNNANNTLSGGVTVNGDMDLTQQSNARVRVYGGLTLNGNLLLGASANNNYGVITFGDATNSAGTFGGTATVVFGNYVANGIDNGSGVGGTNGTLTIAPTITLHGKSGGIYSDTAAAAIVNNGVIAASVSGGTVTISANFLNTNALSAANGGTLALTGTWTNTGTITAGSGSTVNLGGTVTTANMGTIVGTAGSVSLIGTITNTGATLALTSATGSWFDAGAIINGGTISETGGALLIFNNANNTLSGGVTVNGDMDLTEQSNARVRVYGGLTLNGNLLLGSSANNNYGVITFGDATNSAGTLGGNAVVVFGNYVANGIDNGSYVMGASGILTIASTVLIHGKNAGIYSDNNPTGTILNQGTITADTSGGTITISGPLVNQGTIQAINGATVSLTNTVTNASGATLSENASTLSLGSGANAWTNSGTISMTGGTLNYGGVFTPAGIGTVNRSGGTINF